MFLPLLLFRFLCEISKKIFAPCGKMDELSSIWSGVNYSTELSTCNKSLVFGCETPCSYHDLYLTTDTLLLASVIEQIRKVSYSTYGLHSVHYYTCSNLSGDAYMKASKASVELLTAGSHLEMAKNLIRGVISSVFSKHLATMNNKYLEAFDETKARLCRLLVDANNLYDGIEQNFPRPLSDFDIVDV